MAATRLDIQRWFETGKKDGATHLIVACDTFDHSDYPVYIGDGQDGEDVHAKEEELRDKPMTRVVEVYSLSQDMESQLNQDRAFNY